MGVNDVFNHKWKEKIILDTTEEQQLEKYRQILNSLSKEQPIIIRTLDIELNHCFQR